MNVLDQLRAHEQCGVREQDLRTRAQALLDVLTGDLQGAELVEALQEATEALNGLLVDEAPAKEPAKKRPEPKATRRSVSPPSQTAAPSSKRCPDCDADRPVSEFGANKSSRDGLASYCREHIRARNRASYNARHGKSKSRGGSQGTVTPVSNTPRPDLVAVCPTHGEVDHATRNGQDPEGWLLMARSRHHHATRCEASLRLEGAK